MNADYKNDMRFTTAVDSPEQRPAGNGLKDSLMQDLIRLGRAKVRPNGVVVYIDNVWTLCMDKIWRPVTSRA